MHHILFLDYVPDIVERRGPYREAHLQRVAQAKEAGKIVMAGAVGDPPRAALLVFRDVQPAEIERYAQEDPYVQAGLVTEWRVEAWNLV
jgi:uncharacterized protein YciI